MPALEGMHSPGSETAHLLPPAGMKSYKDEVYRFHRVIPYYPPDACVRPNEADLACPPEKPNTKNSVAVMPAGISTRPVSDRFAFHKAREGSSTRPCQPQIGQSRLAAVTQQPCPCFNRCPTVVRKPSYDLQYMYPACVNRPYRPSIRRTPLFHEMSPYINFSTVPSPPENQWMPQACRQRIAKRFMQQCPTTDPVVGSMYAMLVKCEP